jgi:hypothetical protein
VVVNESRDETRSICKLDSNLLVVAGGARSGRCDLVTVNESRDEDETRLICKLDSNLLVVARGRGAGEVVW